ncbi:MAG: rRNA maturation RNase YbeY [Dehalococcoidia bacterium]|nr:MAG: rRNA maturation RNase YbeY [bacterium]MCE7929380.1 rRNA maturation RNase YbeY [Chloroflexi bacterium CFX7]NUQ56815.1 rRNA maturation RNase YbeY [Dehalococcoidia bacterium]RIL04389.1 MAG: rRNA maturation RNase YbeY [bacterium]
MSIEVVIETGAVDIRDLRLLSERVMAGEDVAAGTALAVILTGDDDLRRMNRDFLGIDEPTDVLSFPDEADDFIQGVASEPLLGDIAIALPTAERQAQAAGHPLAAELAHLLVHGILHLCGYDHVNSAEEEAKMRAREEHYLGNLGSMHGH